MLHDEERFASDFDYADASSDIDSSLKLEGSNSMKLIKNEFYRPTFYFSGRALKRCQGISYSMTSINFLF